MRGQSCQRAAFFLITCRSSSETKVSCQNGAGGLGHGRIKCVATPVKIMITKDPSVIVERIEQADHDLPLRAQPHLRSLIEVADIHEQMVR